MFSCCHSLSRGCTQSNPHEKAQGFISPWLSKTSHDIAILAAAGMRTKSLKDTSVLDEADQSRRASNTEESCFVGRGAYQGLFRALKHGEGETYRQRTQRYRTRSNNTSNQERKSALVTPYLHTSSMPSGHDTIPDITFFFIFSRQT
ncbi:hypothetical protein G7K_2029-t1 [Saitoella complicata NRRL Y-17804]|uniref:Uncharacterized protein n=1 Tax=Saitoella complicata (strain BCRC 22490 / CBS 7301 / JCM 7358 / NBRC 10748 / NRRL Y-17804) TaxID=698492 RepID=A0A0E9NDM2_SAICN|nr:hypothetical protein G7K_2029-t1 [Saitoella complicata NRRL Y-17804]